MNLALDCSPWALGLSAAGLSLQAWLPLEALGCRPDELPDDARSIWLLGSPGQRLWDAFQAHLTAFPDWIRRTDPLDDFVGLLLEEARRQWDSTWGTTLLLTPSSPVDVGGRQQFVDFVALASAAGWGRPGPLGMAVHPIYGPWFGLRAAIVTSVQPMSYAAPIEHSPCEHCSAPCVDACPASAVARDGFRVSPCVARRLEGVDCQVTCDARKACPIGVAHRYGQEQLAFFMRSSLAMITSASTS